MYPGHIIGPQALQCFLREEANGPWVQVLEQLPAINRQLADQHQQLQDMNERFRRIETATVGLLKLFTPARGLLDQYQQPLPNLPAPAQPNKPAPARHYCNLRPQHG
ncbi:hypothetical protein PtA15_12A442 [Puccinia triticina]|uniref:Uncharacterized protein n=1 Tax=Puccinia triticina TaxID=208348 RepID=A0ABY7CZX2_9BASI|nr:uncharacterized protein PtA15_12A442 [Puccinia triticina]WAQ90453.1 hypothetical protein PtA15_12A442 [Puccinia triticina]